MAAQIADRTNAGMSFGAEDALSPQPELTKLEAARLAMAEEQKKRIDAAVKRVTTKKESGKRKGLGSPTDAGHRSKKSKTVVDVANDQLDKKNSIARRMVDRFAAMPEPEQEAEHEDEPTTRSVSAQQFVARATSVEAVSPASEKSPRDVTEVTTTVTKVTTVKVTEKKQEKDEEAAEEDEEEKPEWDGPTTNFHVKQLGLDDKVDIYAPVAQQQHDVQRVRERAKYMPSGESIQSLKTSSDSEADSDFAPKLSQESEESEATALPEVDASEVRELAEEAQEFEQQTAEAPRSWAKSLFVVTPLFLLAIVVLVLALLFALDWSQETFQFCQVEVVSAEGSEEVFSCASFVETQSLIKSTLRETAEKVQEAVESAVTSYLE